MLRSIEKRMKSSSLASDTCLTVSRPFSISHGDSPDFFYLGILLSPHPSTDLKEALPLVLEVHESSTLTLLVMVSVGPSKCMS